jgi:type IV secretory pathway VirB4 component
MALASKATQEFVPIREIRDGVVILKDGGMRAVLITSSLNFALKSEDSQNAIIAQFQNLLNSLDFSVQIFLESRRLDIRPYLLTLEERYKAEINELLKTQIREYIDFIKNFTENTNIMTKSFFVVIPFSPTILSTGTKGIADKIPFLNKKEEPVAGPTGREEENFEENRSQLDQRVAVVDQGLIRCGLRAARLGTEELVELYYRLFNPGETDKPARVG